MRSIVFYERSIIGSVNPEAAIMTSAWKVTKNIEKTGYLYQNMSMYARESFRKRPNTLCTRASLPLLLKFRPVMAAPYLL